jgi:hypothetical protein
MKTPAEHFGLKIIGIATTPKIAQFPIGKYEVLEIVDMGSAGKSFMTNTWFTYNNRTPLWVTEQFGAKFKALENK